MILSLPADWPKPLRALVAHCSLSLGGLAPRLLKRGLNVVYMGQLGGKALVCMPVKWSIQDQADLRLIHTSAEWLVTMTDHAEWQHVVLPRPGCGLGGLRWWDVQPILSAILDDRFTCTTFGAHND